MPDGARTVRLAALMAGNAFIFLKLIDVIKTLEASFWQLAGLIALPITGIGTAYFALVFLPASRSARIAETISFGCVCIVFGMWFVGLYFQKTAAFKEKRAYRTRTGIISTESCTSSPSP